MQPNKQGGKPQSPHHKPIMDMLPAQSSHRPISSQAVATKIPPQQPEALSLRSKSVPPPSTPSTSQPKKSDNDHNDIERPSAVFALVLILILIVLSAAVASSYYFFKYKPDHKAVVSNTTKPAKLNSDNIVDDTLGIKFAITKDFTPIDKSTLAKQNPSFLYGYEQKDINNLHCIISQSKLKKPVDGSFSSDSLRDGIIKEVKKSFPDVKLYSSNPVNLDSGQDATALVYQYTDNKTLVKEKMIIANTKTKITFAFCISPQPLFKVYLSRFEDFFNSLKVY